MITEKEDFVTRVSKRVAEAQRESREVDELARIENLEQNTGTDWAKSVEARISRAVFDYEAEERARQEQASLEQKLEEIERQKQELLDRFGK